MLDNAYSRREYVRRVAAAGSVVAIGSSNAVGTSDPGPDGHLRELIKEHGECRVLGGDIVSERGAVITDVFGNHEPGKQDYDLSTVTVVQTLEFEDGYRTQARTGIKLSESQQRTVKETGGSPDGSVVLFSQINGEQYERTVRSNEVQKLTESARSKAEPVNSDETATRDGAVTDSIYRGDTITTSSDGKTNNDYGLPILNVVGSNYKTSTNKCGAAQRSIYLTLNAAGRAEVFYSTYSPSGISDATVSFKGGINGSIANIGMGGYVRALGFVRDSSGTDATEIMDINVGLAQIPYISGGNVYEDYGPVDGPVGDDPALDYEFNTDIASGPVDIGIKFETVFNGIKGGVTQANFMPKREWYQPSGRGMSFSEINIS